MKDKRITKYLYLRQLSILRKKRKAREKNKDRNIRRNLKKSHVSFENKSSSSKFYKRIIDITINAGSTFSIFEKPESVIKLVDEINSYKKKDNRLRRIMIDLSNIKSIDIGAITFLLGKINEMNKDKKILFWGNVPHDEISRQFFYESGFFEYMKSVSGHRFEKHSENYIISIGSDVTLNERVGKSIRNSIKFLTGEEAHYPPVFSIVQEMCANSVEHAKPHSEKKNWFFGINYVKGKEQEPSYVIFTMTDIGYGILKTMKRKFAAIIQDRMANKNDFEILYRAFEKQYQSKTEEINRNRGLPLILDRMERKFITGLKVLTNNVLLDFDQIDKSVILTNNLTGTFYYWKVDLNCIETWKQMNIN